MSCNPKNPCAGFYGLCLDVKIIDACNGICAFCIEKGGRKSKNASVKTLIKKTLLQPVRNILILGGEPLLYPHLKEYLRGVSSSDKRIYLTTNASHLTSELSSKIAPYLEAINLSIHHFDLVVNQTLTGVMLYSSVLQEAIQVLHTSGVRVRLNCNLIKGGIDTFEKAKFFALFAKDTLKADGIRFAELQNAPDQYVAAAEVFPICGIHSEPFSMGCEQTLNFKLPALTGFDMKVRLTCGLVNPKLLKPSDLSGRNQHTLVMYPDGLVDRGWRIENCHEEKKSKSSSETSQPKFAPSAYSCHGVASSTATSCHGAYPASDSWVGGLLQVSDGCHGAVSAPSAYSCHGALIQVSDGCL